MTVEERKKTGTEAEPEYPDALTPLPSVASLTLPNLSHPFANGVCPPRTGYLRLIA